MLTVNDTQVPQTCSLFFNHVTELWVLKLEFTKVQSNIKWEDGFPHLYANFGAAEVVSTQRFARSGDQKWTDVMDGSAWLE
jgi:uncharacterized protein (DUF952 family)